jgi:hypothetical protein
MANRKEGLEKPSLRQIRLADLERLSRLRALYAQATAAKWLKRSEADFRNFVAAAARATRVEGDAVRIFIGIVRGGLWHHLTNADEDRATSALRRESMLAISARNHSMFSPPSSPLSCASSGEVANALLSALGVPNGPTIRRRCLTQEEGRGSK